MNDSSVQRILVTGPARSGKSEWAEQLAMQSRKSVLYVATSRLDPTDAEWQNRIGRHRQRRPAQWQTVEVPVHLADAIASATNQSCLLVDSLGTWLANLLEQSEAEWHQTQGQLLTALQQTEADVIMVAEETGWGIVPAYPLGRIFRDRLGALVRQIGAIAPTTVYLVTAGYALNLTHLGQSIDKPGEKSCDNRRLVE
jgi:adenosylcobinamide kinase/adenosylcobinamide-phosphate guanylyltransferase